MFLVSPLITDHRSLITDAPWPTYRQDGRRYAGVPGTARFTVIEFAEHGIPYRLPSLSAPDPRPRAMRFVDLSRSTAPEHVAERQWRLSVPIATVLLALLAVPLARSRPREGRYGRIAIGMLVFIIYFNAECNTIIHRNG